MTEILKINAKTFININTTLGILTIVTCYIIAQSLNHVHNVLPMISDCFVYKPENYVSRIGVISFICCGNLISNIVIANYYSTTKMINKFLITISCINSFCFGFVGAISETDNLTIHNVCALTGYISYAVYLLIIYCLKLDYYKSYLICLYVFFLVLKIVNTKPFIEWTLTLIYSLNMYKLTSVMQDEYILINI